MKNIYTLLTAILLTALITSCSSSTGSDTEPQFDSYRIGNFMVNQPKKADYIGSENKTKTIAIKSKTIGQSDSIYVNSQDRFYIYVTGGVTKGYFSMNFRDSSYTWGDNVSNLTATYESPFLNDYPSKASNHTYIQFIPSGTINCDSTYKNDEKIIMNYFEKDTLKQVISIDAVGFQETIKEVSCN